MAQAEMIAKAWMDESFRAALVAQGIKVPERPAGLKSVQLSGPGGIRCFTDCGCF